MEIIFETDFIAPWEVAVRRLESQELTQGVPPLPENNYHLTIVIITTVIISIIVVIIPMVIPQ